MKPRCARVGAESVNDYFERHATVEARHANRRVVLVGQSVRRVSCARVESKLGANDGRRGGQDAAHVVERMLVAEAADERVVTHGARMNKAMRNRNRFVHPVRLRVRFNYIEIHSLRVSLTDHNFGIFSIGSSYGR